MNIQAKIREYSHTRVCETYMYNNNYMYSNRLGFVIIFEL